jgi:hypothetical protein
MLPSALIETAVHTAKPYTAHVISGGFSKENFQGLPQLNRYYDDSTHVRVNY